MITYQTTRALSSYGGIIDIQTASSVSTASFSGFTTNETHLTTFGSTSISHNASNGTSVTVSFSNGYTSSKVDGAIFFKSEASTFGSTQTPFSSSSSSSLDRTSFGDVTSFSASHSTSSPGSVTLEVRTTETFESAISTTTSVTTAVPSYTVTGTGTDNSLAFTYKTLSTLTYSFSTRPGTFATTSTSSATITDEVEYGTVIEAGGNEWLWRFDSQATQGSFLSDCGESFSSTVIWPDTTALPVSFATYAIGDTTSTFSIAGDKTTYTEENFAYDAVTYIVTIGDNFSRSTTTTDEGQSVSTTSDTFDGGDDDQTISAFATHSYSTTVTRYSQVTLPQIYFDTAGGKQSTLRGVLPQLYIITTTYASDGFAYNASFSTAQAGSSSGSTLGDGRTLEQTIVSQIATVFYPFGGNNTYIAPAARNGAFLAPQELHSTANPFASGSNLDFGASTVFYPFTVSVIAGVVTPDPRNRSTTDENSHTWRYKWSFDSTGATLSYSDISTYEAGTGTSTSTATGSGTFSVDSSSDTYATFGGSVLGGYQAISTAAESAYFPPRAVKGTSIDDSGGTSSYQSVYSSTASTSVSEMMIVETSLPAFQVFTYATDVATAAYTTFPRN